MKLKTVLVLLALMMGSIIGVFSGLAYISLGDLSTTLRDNATNAQAYAILLNETRGAQVAFQTQVQEWKDILIRGNDKDLYDKYLKNFNEQEKKMDESLDRVKDEMNKLKIESASVDKLKDDHAILGKKYREALATFDPKEMTSGQSVDKLLRGIDRPTSAGLTELANSIEKNATDSLNRTADDAIKSTDESINTFFSVAAGAFVTTIIICFFIGRSVLRKVGAEPSVLAESFSYIAKGDLTKAVPVKDGDESSLAASAALMQLRVKSMIKAIHNGAEELGSAADSASLSSSMVDVKESMRKARTAVRGLSDAADRFKV